MKDLLRMQLEVGEIEFSVGAKVSHEAVIFFSDLYDSPEIRVNAPKAREIAERMARLWNEAAEGLQIQDRDTPEDAPPPLNPKGEA